MSDPKLDLECRNGAKPKVAGPLTTQTIQEEARAAPTEEHALQLRGTDYIFTWGENLGSLRGSLGELP